MTEHTNSVTQVAEAETPQEGGEYTWHNVAQDMEAQNWPEDLRRHAAPHLARHGVAQVAELNAAIPSPMHETHNAAAISERSGDDSEAITSALAKAQKTVMYGIGMDDRFQEKCSKQGVDPYDDMDKASYWSVLADFTKERVGMMREKRGENVQVSSLELMAATPQFLFAQNALNRNDYSELSFDDAKNIASEFNGLIRRFAGNYPHTKALELTAAMIGVGNGTIENEAVLKGAKQSLDGVIKGAQHEHGFKQIVEASGHTFTEANREQDRRGIDGTIDENTPWQIYVDVKASLRAVQEYGSDKGYALRPGRQVIMYSLLKEEEFKETFVISPAIAERKAEGFNRQLAEIHQLLK